MAGRRSSRRPCSKGVRREIARRCHAARSRCGAARRTCRVPSASTRSCIRTCGSDFPALRSLEATPNNLPQQLTSFIGREREIAESGGCSAQSRLLTLLGMGGLGKTRLSLQTRAPTRSTRIPDGVWFLDLAPITRCGAGAPARSRRCWACRRSPGGRCCTTLVRAPEARDALLVILDNCEHLVERVRRAGQRVAATRHRRCASSRPAASRCACPGEQMLPGAAACRCRARGAASTALSRSDAVRLFVDRARLHKPGFALTPSAKRRRWPSSCARLEGIPLALELAAARIRALSVADINARLRDRFKLLTGGGRVLLRAPADAARPGRLVLRAARAERERVLFDRLGVFAGGFDLAAAEAVCGGEPLDAEDVLDLLASLVDKSLVMVEERRRRLPLSDARDDPRLRARRSSAQRGDARATLAARHCDHFLAMAKAANRGLKGRSRPQWTWRVEAELDNLRAAIALALSGGVDPVHRRQVRGRAHGLLDAARLLDRRTQARAGRARRCPTCRPRRSRRRMRFTWAPRWPTSQSDHAEAARHAGDVPGAAARHRQSEVDIAATLSTLSLVRLQAGDADERARRARRRRWRYFAGWAIASARRSACCISARSLCTSRTTTAPRTQRRACLAIGREIGHCEIESECERVLGEIALESADLARRAAFPRR